MANFRELTKKEKKLFNIFKSGYVAGIYSVPSTIRAKAGASMEPGRLDILDAYKVNVSFFKRSKEAYKEFHNGYFTGWFKCLATETTRQLLDPDLCDDVNDYIQSIWLHDRVYGTDKTTD